MRSIYAYEGKVIKPFHDIRGSHFRRYHHPEAYQAPQNFGKKMREIKSWGLIYQSVRHLGGQCIAAFRPPAISIPKQILHLRYVWNGKNIVEVFDAKLIIRFD